MSLWIFGNISSYFTACDFIATAEQQTAGFARRGFRGGALDYLDNTP